MKSNIVLPGDPNYPTRLSRWKGRPRRLFVRGDIPRAEHAVAIVGARAAVHGAMQFAQTLAQQLARQGILIISGGAIGVDTSAHKGALLAGGGTIAVLGSGLDRPYPTRNVRLFDNICSHGGAVVTSFADGAPPRASHFVQRNGIIAGLADATVVVAANPRSGSLHTVRFARSLGRPVGAVPGTPGCQLLLAQGAHVIESAQDVVAMIRGQGRLLGVELPDPDSKEGRVYAQLGEVPKNIECLVGKTGLPPISVTCALTRLELSGLALPVPGSCFIRSSLAAEVNRNRTSTMREERG